MTPEDIECKIEKLEAKPGDCVVFFFEQVLSPNTISRLRPSIEAVIPDGVKGIILDGGAKALHIQLEKEERPS